MTATHARTGARGRGQTPTHARTGTGGRAPQKTYGFPVWVRLAKIGTRHPKAQRHSTDEWSL